MPITPEQAPNLPEGAPQGSGVPPQQDRGSDTADRQAEALQLAKNKAAAAKLRANLRPPTQEERDALIAAEKKSFVPLRVVIEDTAPKGTWSERLSNLVHGGTTVTRGSDAARVTFRSVQAMHASDRYERLRRIIGSLAPREPCLFAMELIHQLKDSKGVLDAAAFEEVVTQLTAHCKSKAAAVKN